MSIDHTISWEVARVGGMLAYVLASASVVIGMLVSLKLRSPNWPRFVTTELHRFVSVLTLVFTVVHGVAVWLDPFTGFTPTEVLVPMASHYRPMWIAFGIVGGYLLVAVWGSEYVRRWIGYAWWRRLHYATFAVFVLGTLHGIGAGSDTSAPWALAFYAVCTGSVLVLVGWRLLSGPASMRRSVAFLVIGAAVAGLAVFAVIGPAQSGWNAIANDGNGSGVSDAWLAAHPTTPTAPSDAFEGTVTGSLVATDELSGTFEGARTGSFDLRVGPLNLLSLALDDGWSCSGPATVSGSGVSAACAAGDGSAVEVDLSALRRADDRVLGHIAVIPTPPAG
jgi:hypothetical protein